MAFISKLNYQIHCTANLQKTTANFFTSTCTWQPFRFHSPTEVVYARFLQRLCSCINPPWDTLEWTDRWSNKTFFLKFFRALVPGYLLRSNAYSYNKVTQNSHTGKNYMYSMRKNRYVCADLKAVVRLRVLSVSVSISTILFYIEHSTISVKSD